METHAKTLGVGSEGSELVVVTAVPCSVSPCALEVPLPDLSHELLTEPPWPGLHERTVDQGQLAGVA